jgi:GT2 family glycosyltransferase
VGVELTAVVLNWRTAELAERSARALIRDGVPSERVVVVDNGSGDGSAERLATALPDSVVLPLPENVGFARANNEAAAHLPGDAYLFVNSDAFVHDRGSVQRMLERLATAAIVVPRLLNQDLTLQRNVVPRTSFAVELVRASGASRLVTSPRWSTHWNHADARAVDAAIGAVVVVRADAWADLGGFDERRFMYAEDLDLFWRARMRGWPIWFEPGASFVHLGGASAGRRWSSPQRAVRVAAAEADMIRAHRPVGAAIATLGVMAAGTAARAGLALGTRDRERARELAAFTRGYLARPRRV